MKFRQLFLAFCAASIVTTVATAVPASADTPNSATTSTTINPDDRRDPANPVSTFKHVNATQTLTGTWNGERMCGIDSTPNQYCDTVTDTFSIKADAGKLTVTVNAHHWNSGPDYNEAFTVTSNIGNAELHSTGPASATFTKEFTSATDITFVFDHSNWGGGSVQPVVTWNFTPTPPPAKTDVDFNGTIVCASNNGTTTYTLTVSQKSGPAATFSPANGASMQNGNNVDVTATWTDPNYGPMTKTMTVAGTADCTPALTPPPAPPVTKTVCPSGVTVFGDTPCPAVPTPTLG